MMRHSPIPGSKESLYCHRWLDVSFGLVIASMIFAAYQIGAAEGSKTAIITVMATAVAVALMFHITVIEAVDQIDQKILTDQKAAAKEGESG